MNLFIAAIVSSIFSITMSSAQMIDPIKAGKTHHLYHPDIDLGPLFTAVQMARIFKDSKTFVDCSPKQSPDSVVRSYLAENDNPGFVLMDFVTRHFHIPDSLHVAPPHKDTSMMAHLKGHWHNLVKQATDSEKWNTLINLPHPYVVPGGRFREMFYWDSYFTIIGLLESNQDELALGMIQNFEYLVNTFGHIPNGNRTYFLSRSQPPFFAEMIKAYGQKHGMASVVSFLPALENEYRYWTKDDEKVNSKHPIEGKSVWLNGTVLQRYTGGVAAPRPEAFNKEYNWAQELPETARDSFYLNMQAACESGWDFSGRWFADGQHRSTVHAQNLVPVCLNSLLYNIEMQIAAMYNFQKNTTQSAAYQQKAALRKAAILKYCWWPEEGIFTDYQSDKQTFNPHWSLAMVYPLFFEIATPQQADAIAKMVAQKFLMTGGLVTTPYQTGEQWDSPNGWAPMQWLAVVGLHHYGHTKLAQTIAERWLQVNEQVYKNEGKMMEKYNVVNPDLPGGGGNYENQDGFGWTNGVALALDAWLKKLKE